MTATIKAYVFDVYGTLFDVHSVKEKCEEFFPNQGESISITWRKKQLEYFFLRQIMGNYEDFQKVTEAALKYALSEHNQQWTPEIEHSLMDAYLNLSLYPEVQHVLEKLQNKKLAIFSNGTANMLTPLAENAGIAHYFDHILSVDEIKQYKPSLASYNYALKTLGVKREEVLFLSSNGWDIAGAKNFGFHTAWINRNELPMETLNLKPDKTYKNLNDIMEW
ncbi:2-haloalkanoic acid dehalogenase [Bacillus sp. THAF10]|uniref:haloacid dehalogenase type II n=1 Tax=Bacillus sp. THAF10 TaxID=2587848 RepID=UPI0012689A87|nr:haloacid dehalogenase type II [Bacillus sp. THAF10]QFT87875.1 2-haloalkanoic acid dehalogenase [Bacillus sp. THAF10]